MDTTVNTTETTTAYGLKWHNFLIYFSLWASALLNIALGLTCMAEGDPLYGFVLVCAAVYTIFVRFQLAAFKENARMHLLAAQLIVLVADLLLMGIDPSSLASSVAGIGINYIYYKKREDMFVN